ncbi:10349_t:CDS:1, partial [Ambispora leptoticha]
DITRIGRVYKYRVYRLVVLAFCPKGDKEYVNHIDGNSTNNRTSNLGWCTPKENTRHDVRLGLYSNNPIRRAFKIFDDENFRP